MAAFAEHGREVTERVFVVLDQQDPQVVALVRAVGDEARTFWHVSGEFSGVAAWGTTLSSSRKVEPCPRPGLDAVSRPPRASASDRLIASPSPSPPDRPRTSASPCSNGSNNRGNTWGSIPIPVSSNSIASQPASLSSGLSGVPGGFNVRIVRVPPAGVNLAALRIRFQTTCMIRAWSAVT